MSRAFKILVAILIVAIGLNIFQYVYFTKVRGTGVPHEDVPRDIGEVKGDDWEDYIGEEVTVVGFLVVIDDQLMLVEDPDDLATDQILPEEAYLRLTGDIPEEMLNYLGDKVSVKGTLLCPGECWEKRYIELEFILYEPIFRPMERWEPEIFIPVVVDVPLKPIPTKYAVLISGGADARNAYTRYWNDMKYMYSILVNRYDYDPDNIYVIYKDGVGEDTDIPVDYAATRDNVQAVFDELALEMGDGDKLFLFLNNHGGGFSATDGHGHYLHGGVADTDLDEPEAGYSESYYNEDFNGDGDRNDVVRIDEILWLYSGDLSEWITDDELAAMLDGLEYDRVIIFMKQCFSGGFIRDLSGNDRVILAACQEEESSWSADTEGSYGEFSYHFMKAVNMEVPADANSNGFVSMSEAFNYASAQDSRPETPLYDDNGDGIGHSGPVPSGGDGTLGAVTYL